MCLWRGWFHLYKGQTRLELQCFLLNTLRSGWPGWLRTFMDIFPERQRDAIPLEYTLCAPISKRRTCTKDVLSPMSTLSWVSDRTALQHSDLEVLGANLIQPLECCRGNLDPRDAGAHFWVLQFCYFNRKCLGNWREALSMTTWLSEAPHPNHRKCWSADISG